jgi:CBS domain-containing protein
MTKDLALIEDDAPVYKAAKAMSEFGVGCILIRKEDKVVGIITERDIVRRVICEDKDPHETLVRDIMTKPVIVVKEEATIEDAADIMAKNGVRRLPVINEKSSLVGLITASDLAKALAIKFEMQNSLFNAMGRVRPPPKEMYV